DRGRAFFQTVPRGAAALGGDGRLPLHAPDLARRARRGALARQRRRAPRAPPPAPAPARTLRPRQDRAGDAEERARGPPLDDARDALAAPSTLAGPGAGRDGARQRHRARSGAAPGAGRRRLTSVKEGPARAADTRGYLGRPILKESDMNATAAAARATDILK